MSNFICSECGMTNIDCGGAGYKTPKEIELENQNADLSKKVHILNEQNTKQYNELCEEIKKNNILEKKLEIAIKALKKIIRDYEINGIGYLCVTRAKEALKEMEGVK